METRNRSPKRRPRRLRRLLVVVPVAILGLLVVGAALAIFGDTNALKTPQGVGALEEELARALSSAEGASRLRLSEESLSRIGAAALKEVGDSTGGSFTSLGFHAEAERDYLAASVAFEMRLPGAPLKRAVRTTASVGLRVESVAGEVLLTPQKFWVGRLPLPAGVLASVYDRFSAHLTASEAPIRFKRGDLVVPIELINQEIPRVVAVKSVHAVPAGVDLILEADMAMLTALLAEGAPIMAHMLPVLSRELKEQGLNLETEVEELLAAASEPLPAPADPLPTALVCYLENEVWVRSEIGRFVPELGEDLFAPSAVRTGASSATELLLRDKSVLRVSEETEFELATLPEGTERSTEILLHSGALRAKVNKLVTGEARFTVRTDGAILGVRGTDLFVSVEPDGALQVAVLEGSVAVEQNGAQALLLEANQEVEVSRDAITAGTTETLEPTPLKPARRREIEAAANFTASLGMEGHLREQYRLAMILSRVRRIGTELMAMEPEKQRSLAERLRRNVDMNWAEAEFRRLMQIPEFEELMAAFGVQRIGSPTQE